MRLGPGLPRSFVVLTLVCTPALSGCGLLDGGSTVEDAFEYLPADTFSVAFADRGAMAERLGVDDIDPRDVSDGDLDDYTGALEDERESAVAGTRLSPYVAVMKDAPLNDLDIEWEAFASWGDADEDDVHGSATVWKVGDDLDFDALAGDLEDKGYDKGGSGDLPIYTVDQSAVDAATGLIGGVYPATMLSVLLDEDEQVIATAVDADPLGDIADVVTDDTDSLADSGDMDELLDAADGDPELALLTSGGPGVCPDDGRATPQQDEQYAGLGRPQGRALFVTADDEPEAVLALQFDSEGAAEDDLEARRSLVEDGVDARTNEPFDTLGDFDLEQDGDLVLIDERFDDGVLRAVQAETDGAGAGVCAPPD